MLRRVCDFVGLLQYIGVDFFVRVAPLSVLFLAGQHHNQFNLRVLFPQLNDGQSRESVKAQRAPVPVKYNALFNQLFNFLFQPVFDK